MIDIALNLREDDCHDLQCKLTFILCWSNNGQMLKDLNIN